MLIFPGINGLMNLVKSSILKKAVKATLVPRDCRVSYIRQRCIFIRETMGTVWFVIKANAMHYLCTRQKCSLNKPYYLLLLATL